MLIHIFNVESHPSIDTAACLPWIDGASSAISETVTFVTVLRGAGWHLGIRIHGKEQWCGLLHRICKLGLFMCWTLILTTSNIFTCQIPRFCFWYVFYHSPDETCRPTCKFEIMPKIPASWATLIKNLRHVKQFVVSRHMFVTSKSYDVIPPL